MLSKERNAKMARALMEGPAADVSPVEAVLGFAAWLTVRQERVVLSANDDASDIALLVENYRITQGWPEPRENIYPHNLKPGPDVPNGVKLRDWPVWLTRVIWS